MGKSSAEGDVGEASGEAGFRLFETDTLAVENELRIGDQRHAVAGGKGFCPSAYEVNVGTFIEDESRSLDGVAEVFDASYTTSAEGGAIHEQGIELNCTLGGEEAAAAGIEGGVIFEDGDGGFDGVGGRASPIEDGVAGFEGLGYTGLVILRHFRGNCPGSAVDDEGRFGGVREHDGRTCYKNHFPLRLNMGTDSAKGNLNILHEQRSVA
jgi:hypothetical protein